MLDSSAGPCRLTTEGCRARQRRLADWLARSQLHAALLTTRSYVYYFTGYWPASYHTPLLFLSAAGEATLIAPDGASDETIAIGDAASIDDLLSYDWQQLGTLVDDFAARAFRAAVPLVAGLKSIACDAPLPPHFLPTAAIDISPELLALRRAKDADEIDLVRQAIRGCEAAYVWAAEFIRPGVREIDIYAEVQSAAIRELGVPIGELGNDFQAGTSGGPPRTRTVERGELMPLDVSVNYRGYRCDLCRTFVVDDEPTAAQTRAAELVLATLAWVEQVAAKGVSAQALDQGARTRLANDDGWVFPHHLGHGIGLGVHEAPRLNPHWDDVLTAGDLFTIEPGLYGNDLRGGVRIEDNYWIGPSGLEKLSVFPRGLVLAGR